MRDQKVHQFLKKEHAEENFQHLKKRSLGRTGAIPVKHLLMKRAWIQSSSQDLWETNWEMVGDAMNRVIWNIIRWYFLQEGKWNEYIAEESWVYMGEFFQTKHSDLAELDDNNLRFLKTIESKGLHMFKIILQTCQ